MIDPKALQESLNNLPPYGPEFQHIVSAARLVLAAVPTKDAVEAVANALHIECGCHRNFAEELARAALIAAGVHTRTHGQDADLWSPPSHGPGDDVAREHVQRERDAFRAGAEAMREICARASFALLASDADIPEHYGSEIAARIRALLIPLPGGQTS